MAKNNKKIEVEKLQADLSAEVQKAKAEIDRLKKELKKKKKYGLVWEEKTEGVVEMCKPARRSFSEGGEANLLDRFKVLIKDARFFDSLVGYFYISGFYKPYQVLSNRRYRKLH